MFSHHSSDTFLILLVQFSYLLTMYSSSSSTSSHAQALLSIGSQQGSFAYEGPRVTCHCDLPAPLWVSWSNRNPGRRFFSCQLFEMGCSFFRWHDPKMSPRAKHVILSLRDSERTFYSENQTLNVKYQLIRLENEELYDKLQSFFDKNERLSVENKELQEKIKMLQNNLDDFFLSHRLRTRLFVITIIISVFILLLSL